MKIRDWFPWSMALTVVLGCGDSTSPGENDFDPISIEEQTDSLISGVSGNPALQSLTVLGKFFPNLSAGPPPADLPRLLTPSLTGPVVAEWIESAYATERDRSSSSQPNSALEVLPADLLGTTFIFNDQTAEYEPDPNRTGAPGDGVRFILYEVDAIAQAPISPASENEIGHLDLTDQSEGSINALRIIAVVDDVIMLQYEASGSVNLLDDPTATLQADGFLSDGSEQIDFEISIDASTSSITIDYSLSSASGSSLRLQISAAGISADVTITLVTGSGTVVIDATQNVSGSTSGTISHRGEVVVSFEGDEEEVVFTRSSGEPLTGEESRALEDLVDLLDESLESLNGLLEPACLVFLACVT